MGRWCKVAWLYAAQYSIAKSRQYGTEVATPENHGTSARRPPPGVIRAQANARAPTRTADVTVRGRTGPLQTHRVITVPDKTLVRHRRSLVFVVAAPFGVTLAAAVAPTLAGAAAPKLPGAMAGAPSSTRAQAPAVSGDRFVARALRYVEAYEKAFSAVVCEERQKQCLVRPKEKVETHRDLRFDFLRVKKEEIRIPK